MSLINITKYIAKILACVFFIFYHISFSHATLTLKIDSSNENNKSNILFFGFQNQDPDLNKNIKLIASQIESNLLSTNLFNTRFNLNTLETILDDNTIEQNITLSKIDYDINSQSVPNFLKYKKQNISAIIVAEFSYDEVGNIETKIRGWDTLDQEQLFGRHYIASKDNINKIANYITNEIYTKLTGEKFGHFNSKIAYIAESGSFLNRKKKLAIINFDGTKRVFLTDGSDLVLTPAFSIDRSTIYYLKYFLDKPQIFKTDLKTGKSIKATGFRDSNFALSLHPKDKNKILLSATIDKNTDIYEYDMNTNASLRITNNSAIDTTASYSPDGTKIAFTSDRDGKQQIYVINYDQYSINKITSNNASYSKPKWSPDGKYIAFTKIKNNQFYAGIMLPDGTNEKILASAYLLEGVKWSPNSRYIIYSKQRSAYGYKSIPKIFITDIITGFEYQIPTPEKEGATDPDWVF